MVSFYTAVVFSMFRFLSIIWGSYALLMSKTLIIEWGFITGGALNLTVTLLLDYVRLIFVGVVIFISSIVLVYRRDYILSDRAFYRFIILVVLFVISMLLIVLRPNIIRILLGWDGLGLVSYCLIIFYQNERSAGSGMLTILSNRVGDIAILLAIRWIAGFGSWGIFSFVNIVGGYSFISLILGLVILAAMTKSAQIPFSAWLPAAIAAPTPVSALVHSSTLVTAGVYLLIRFRALIEFSGFLFLIGLCTILISGLSACFEQDAKKIIALSTLSQLGVIVFSVSLGIWEIAFFHLLTHALFKSLLFLCIGLYIHGSNNQQDLRGIGSQLINRPLSSCFFFTSSLSLRGFPFLSGFYSKDLIIEVFEISGMGILAYMLVLFSLGFTVIYRIRLINFLWVIEFNFTPISVNYGEGLLSTVPMLILYLFSVVGGASISQLIIPLICVNIEFIIKILLLVLVGVVLFISLITFFRVTVIEVRVLTGFLGEGLGLMWFLYDLCTSFLLQLLNIRSLFLIVVDQGWLEICGIQGSMTLVSKISLVLNKFLLVRVRVWLFRGVMLLLVILFLDCRYSLIRVKEWRFLGGYCLSTFSLLKIT